MPRPRTAVTADVRRSNAGILFSRVLTEGPCSRKDLREGTGLVSGTVTTIVSQLIDRGLVQETGEAVSTRGRPQRLLTTVPGRVLGCVVDIGITTARSVLIDLAGDTVWEAERDHDALDQGADAVVDAVRSLLAEAERERTAHQESWCAGTVIAAPGPVRDASVLVASLGIPVNDLDLLAPLASSAPALGGPRQVVNGGRLAALAEFMALEQEERPRALAYIGAAPLGVHGGLIIDGSVFTGQHGLAGEVGHIVVDSAGAPCACGARGCLTTVLATGALARRAGVAEESRDPLTDLIALLRDEDPTARDAVADAARDLSAAIATLSNLTDIGLVVLGEDLAALHEWLRPAVDDLLSSRARVTPLFNPEVTKGVHGGSAAVQGARELVFAGLREDPLQVPDHP